MGSLESGDPLRIGDLPVPVTVQRSAGAPLVFGVPLYLIDGQMADVLAAAFIPMVLLVRDVLQPIDDFAVELFLKRDVRHRGGRGSTMPVLLTWREPYHITGSNLLHQPTFTLNPAAPGGHDKRLTEWVRMPGSPGTRLESHAGTRHKCRIGCLKQGIDSHCAGEPF